MENSFLRQYLSSNENYQRTEEIKQNVLHKDMKYLKQLQLSIAQILIDENESPTTKLMAIKLNKELVETFNTDYIFLVQKTLLPIYEEIAKFKSTSEDPDKGTSYFLKNVAPNSNNKDLQITGQQFVRVILECIRVWSRWFPLDFKSYYLSSFKITYEKLVKLGVKFPPLQYFDNIEQNIPNQLIPLPMIIQLRELLKKQLNTNTRNLKNYLAMNPAHYFYQHKYSTYKDFFKQIKTKNPIQKNKILRKATFQLEKEFENLELIKNDVNAHPLSAELLQVENLCLQNLNNSLAEKVPELQSQIIQLQNKVNLLEKQLLERNEKINELQTELRLLQKQKTNEIQNFLAQNDLSNSELFQTDITRMKLHYGLFDQNHEIEKYKYLLSQADFEIQELTEKLEDASRKKKLLQDDNKMLNQTILVLERKLFLNGKQSYKPLPSQQNLSEYKQTATTVSIVPIVPKKMETTGFQNSILITLRQQVKHQTTFINNLQNQISKFTQLLSYSGRQSLYQTNQTLSKHGSNINELKKGPFHSPSSTSQPKSRGSKEIQPPFVNYNAKLFAIPPDAFTVKFKQACLLQKTILLSDENLQIGVQTSLQQNQELLINLVFHNRSKEPIQNFSLQLKPAENIKLHTYPQKIQQNIKSNEQVSFKIFISIETIPYQLVEFSIYYYLNQEYSFNLCLPCTINKFIMYKELPFELPKSYFYNSKLFMTSFQNQLSTLLPDFQIIQNKEQNVEAYAKISILQQTFIVCITCQNQQMQIKLNGSYQDQLVEFIVSTFQGLFLKR